ncbi:RNA-directed DNA polymerase from mobile element jockey [Elysia marginata]|uniref:RNA-directed DNA polymerase from mobile element jockey n=1 Tax=Elysia marginata TaxID=1093978 RepID=A0AAV4J4C7_9GAST|nr:RNA-directed DNA polymerase from mobile element jockey [Elysia marginata]
MTCPFVMEELEGALKVMQNGRSPGPDNITNEMLAHLGFQAKRKILSLFNTSWKTGLVPSNWKKAILIPILKVGKPKNKGNSYRPISLTSCMCKLMERMINKRLVWHLEKHNILMDEQAGFRQFQSTEDQVAYIAQTIEDGYQRQQHTVTVWVGMEKAFDRVWKKGLILQLMQAGVSHNMLKWIQNYLSQRTGRVNLQGRESRQAIFKDGVPQGGVLFPTLFLVFMNSIQNIIKPHVKAALYADDLALICSEDSCGTAQVRLQECLTLLEQWTDDWAMTVNAAKTTYSIFSLSTKIPNLRLRINNSLLEKENYPKYLGVTFDTRLTWCKQIETVQKNAVRRTLLLKKLAGTSWGADMKLLKKTYVGYVRPVMEYGIAAWGTASKTNFQKIERVQNHSLRIMTGGIKSTPINSMESVTGLESLEDRRKKKIVCQYTKFQHLANHPMCKLITNNPRKRLKRTNFTASAQQIHKSLELPDLRPDTPLQSSIDWPPWNQQNQIEIVKDIDGVTSKKSMIKRELHCLTQNMLDKKYPSNYWIRAFTVESASEAVRDGGDARSVLDALDSTKCPEVNALAQAITTLSLTASKLVLQRIPGHVDIFGNDVADQLAKEGGMMEQIQHNPSYNEAKTLINSALDCHWRQEHPQHNSKDAIHKLSRAEQVTIFRLRTGHNRLKHHLFSRLKLEMA